MQRYLRIYLLACIALAFGYLVVHAREPLRLNLGDAWTDASVLTSITHIEQHGFASDTTDPLGAGPFRATGDPPLPEILYGALGNLLGTHEITVFRLIALLFSAFAAWLLYQYARRMWNDTVAIIATALTTTSLVWMMFADSIHRTPIVHAACFLALWGVARALETEQRRHYLAVLVGTFACFFAASNDWLFLPLGVLFTIQVKRGNPFARGNWRLLAVCAAGGLLAVLLRSPFVADPSNFQLAFDQRIAATFVTLVRRYTVLLTPMLWITLGWAIWRALRAPSVKAAIEDGTTWMLVAALVFAYLLPPHPESATLRTQLLLPLYAIGSALLLARLFDHGHWRRMLAVAGCVVAPLWGFWLMFSHPREVLDREDVARANEYLAHNDGNGFVMSNLLADAPMLSAFGRHGWTALHDPDPSNAHVRMLEFFEAAGTDYAHAVIFTTPGSRFIDRSIPQVIRRRMPSVDGWPYLVRAKVNGLIEVYDQQVMRSLEAVGAKRVLQLSNFDIFRIDRATTLETASRSLPVVNRIDFASISTASHQLMGWGSPIDPNEARPTLSSIGGYGQCRNPLAVSTKPARNMCAVVETAYGLDVADVGGVSRAELMVRVDRVCDQQLTITLAAPARADVSFNGVPVLACGDPQWGTTSATVRIPQQHVRPGLNIIGFHDRQVEPKKVRPELTSVVIEPSCLGQEQLPAPDPAP